MSRCERKETRKESMVISVAHLWSQSHPADLSCAPFSLLVAAMTRAGQWTQARVQTSPYRAAYAAWRVADSQRSASARRAPQMHRSGGKMRKMTRTKRIKKNLNNDINGHMIAPIWGRVHNSASNARSHAACHFTAHRLKPATANHGSGLIASVGSGAALSLARRARAVDLAHLVRPRTSRERAQRSNAKPGIGEQKIDARAAVVEAMIARLVPAREARLCRAVLECERVDQKTLAGHEGEPCSGARFSGTQPCRRALGRSQYVIFGHIVHEKGQKSHQKVIDDRLRLHTHPLATRRQRPTREQV